MTLRVQTHPHFQFILCLVNGVVPTFGLPASLHIPIAAKSVESLEAQVGSVIRTQVGRNGRINAVLIEADVPDRNFLDPIELWRLPDADAFFERLHPKFQVWVHVDFTGYRNAYHALRLQPASPGEVLDHIQNRRAVRLRGYSHPYLRLCPVSKAVNTNAGGRLGSEGLERTHIASVADLSPEWQAEIARILSFPIQYADPADLTKMLNIAPGTQVLGGVRDFQRCFY